MFKNSTQVCISFFLSLEKKNNLWSIFGGDITHLKEVICALTTDSFSCSFYYLAKWQERRKELKQKRINRMKEKEMEKFKLKCRICFMSAVFLTRSIMFRYRNGFLSLGFIV
jgi:hypothetical protein